MDTEVILEVNNEIDYFIVNATREWGLHHRKDVIMVNAQKIYEVLEKQIPKKPAESDDVIKSDYQCPNCKEYWDCDTEYGLKYLSYKCCPCCGQAIDWREVEE